jgi:hypothetical protein
MLDKTKKKNIWTDKNAGDLKKMFEKQFFEMKKKLLNFFFD